MLLAVIDTNVLLEFHPPSEVDWLGALKVPEVALIITPVVLRELQQIKDGRTTVRAAKRATAGERIKQLETWLADPGDDVALREFEFRTGCKVRFHGTAVPDELFEKHRLDKLLNDDRLVATARALADANEDVVVLSDDAGPLLLARSLGLRTRRPPKESRLQGSVVTEQARAPVERLPKLDLEPGDNGFRAVTLHGPISDDRAEREPFRIRRALAERYNDMSLRFHTEESVRDQARAQGLVLVDSDRHDRRADEFEKEVTRVINRLHSQQRFRDLYGELGITVRNRGDISSPASVFLQLPNDAPATWANELPELDWPHTPLVLMREGTFFDVESPDAPIRTAWRVRDRIAEFDVPDVKHDAEGKFVSELPSLFLRFNSFDSAKGFEVFFRVQAPTGAPCTGHFAIRVDKKEPRVRLELPLWLEEYER